MSTNELTDPARRTHLTMVSYLREVTKPGVLMMVGPFPPPTHGMAAVNEAVRASIERIGVQPVVFDLAAPSLNRDLLTKLSRLPRVLRKLSVFAWRSRGVSSTLYLSASAGLGQVYDVMFVLLARWRGMRLRLHHHSFAYLDSPSTIARFLMRVAGPSAVHVALSVEMAERLRKLYGIACSVTLSNAGILFPLSLPPSTFRSQLKTLGFLSNISAEKGIFDYLDLLAEAHRMGLRVEGRVAGPFQDDETERRVLARIRALKNVQYVGPKYGVEKEEFLSGIDALIFPTQYSNEAEPLVVHEAMSRSIPVVAYGRGCIPEILSDDCGRVIDMNERFVPAAINRVIEWLENPVAFQAASEAAKARYIKTFTENKERWDLFFEDLKVASGLSLSIQHGGDIES